ncbi:MAG: ribosome maturation factor RimM [Flavobacteriales bacterium]
MTKDDCFYLGTVQKKHGYKGDFIAKFDADDVSIYENIEALFFDFKGNLVPMPLTKCEFLKKDTFLLHIDGYDSEDDLYKVLGSDLYLPLDLLPKLEGNAFYYHEVVGFDVVDKEKGNIGKVVEIRTDTAQDILYILSNQDNETQVLIPLTNDIYTGLSKEKKEFYIEAPSGLIDLYFQVHKQSDEED